MAAFITSSAKPKGKVSLYILISLYIILSAFSFYELIHISEVLSNTGLRIKLLIAFGISIALPVYLIFAQSIISKWYIRFVVEITSIVIIITMFGLTCPPTATLREVCCEVFSILMTDLVSSLLLVICHNLYQSYDSGTRGNSQVMSNNRKK